MLANLLSYYMVHRYTNYSIELNSQVNFLLVPLKGNLTSITALQNTMWQNQSFCSVFVLGKFLQFDMLIMKNLLQPFHSFVTENWKIKNLSNHIKSQNWAIFSYFDIMCSFMRTFFFLQPDVSNFSLGYNRWREKVLRYISKSGFLAFFQKMHCLPQQ